MANIKQIGVGAIANDGTGDPLRDAFVKLNENSSSIQHYMDRVNDNDWYDPNFIRNYNGVTSVTLLSEIKNDFGWGRTTVSNVVVDGFNCTQFVISDPSAQDFLPSFSRVYLSSKGYEDGNTAKLGFWLKIPLASPTKTYRLYKGNRTTTDSVPTINNSNWNWYEITNERVITAASWQDFQLAIRDGLLGEKCYIRGMTLVNTTKDTWTGERASYRQMYAQNQPFINLNGYLKHCPPWIPLFTNTDEQNGNGFSVEQITISDLKIKGARFTGLVDTQLRLNLDPYGLTFATNSIFDRAGINGSKGYFNVGMYIEIQSPIPYNGFSAYYGDREDQYFMGNQNYGERIWVETGPILIDETFLAKSALSMFQISVTANTGVVPVVDVYGITLAVNEDPMEFRYQPKTIADGSRFRDKYLCSYGDSITAELGWQQPVLVNHGVADQFPRGIGGTTVSKASNGTIAWVDADGAYIARPPSAPPAGTEGIDYFEIESYMAGQQRVDTIPLATDLLLIMAGANDYAQNVPIGFPTDAASDLLGATFYASYKSMLIKLHTRLPNTEIVIINLPFKQNEEVDTNTNGDTYEEFREAIRMVSKQYGLFCIEVNRLGVNSLNWTNYSIDSIHPKPNFYTMMGYLINENLKLINHVNPQKNN